MKAEAMVLVAFTAILRGCAADNAPKEQLCPSSMTVKLNTGACMPRINLGGYNHSRPSNRTLWLEVGGRGFDTCSYIDFDEQRAVGDAVAASNIPRDEIFITTKVPCCPNSLWGCEPTEPWAGMNIPGDVVRKAANVSMELLRMDYVDLMLLGMPCDKEEDTIAAYQALEELRTSGKTRAIGISNFNKADINALMKEVAVVPAINQCEYFIGHHSVRNVRGNDPETLKQCQDLGITFSGYSIFGFPTPSVLHDPDVMAVAAAHNKSAAEIALRWEVQQGIVAIVASNKESHDRSDLGVFNFSLTQDEMARLNKTKCDPSTTVELNTGACAPLISFGGWNESRPSNRTLWLEVGGRGFDSASWDTDDVQKELGDAVAASDVPRDEIFITTKVPCCPNSLGWGCEPTEPWAGMKAGQVVQKAANVSMELLHMDYVDLLLLGMPCDTMEDTVAAYRALEELRASGKARAIGISNFNASLINALMKEVTVMPAINQCEFSIGFNNSELGSDPETRTLCQDLGITFSGYSVFGAPPDFVALHDPAVVAVAVVHNKSAAEIALRWVVQQGAVAVTSSNKVSHDRSDLGVFSFNLTQDEMVRLDKV